MALDLGPPPLILPKPGIIRAAEPELLKPRHGLTYFCPPPPPNIAAAAAPATIAHTASLPDGSFSGSQAHAGVSIGTAADDRYIIAIGICDINAAGRTFNRIEMDGATMTPIAGSLGPSVGTSTHIGQAAILAKPAGTTASFEMFVDGGAVAQNCISIFSVTGLLSTTAVDSFATSLGVTTDTYQTTIDHLAGGVVAGMVLHSGNGSAVTVAWSGLTEHDDANISGFVGHSAASAAFASAASGVTMGVVGSANLHAQSLMIIVSMR